MDNFDFKVDCKSISNDTKVLRDGILEFNNSIINDTPDSFNIFARDKNEIIAGAIVYQHRDALYLDVLWCAENYRGQGIGSKIMDMIEDEARKRCRSKVFVDTYDFQSQDFYKKKGFRVIGCMPEYLLGHDRIYLRKDI